MHSSNNNNSATTMVGWHQDIKDKSTVFTQERLVASKDTNPKKNGNARAHRKSAKKKEKDAGPRRALSAYNLFFQQERAVLLETLPVRESGKPRRSHGKIGFADMARVIGARWKAIKPERKAHFEILAIREKERYATELREYKEQQNREHFAKAKLKSTQQARMREVQHLQFSAPTAAREYNQGLFMDQNINGDLSFQSECTDVPLQAFDDFHEIGNGYQAARFNGSPTDDLQPLEYFNASSDSPPTIANLAKNFSREEINCLVGAFL